MIVKAITTAVKHYPAVLPHLTGRARFIAFALGDWKTVEQFDARLSYLVTALYDATIPMPEFVDALAALIGRQITLAYREAWADEGEGDFPSYLTDSSETFILNQYDFVDGFARDIVDARIDELPIDGLLARVPLWAGQYDTAYREAVRLIRTENGGNLEWVKGQTEHGCSTCDNLNGIVMSAREWETLGVHPRGYPNSKLECQGGGPGNNCDCDLAPTDKRRSPGAYGRVEEIIL